MPVSSPTCSDASFFSMDLDADKQSTGQATPIATWDEEEQVPGDLLSHIPGMFRVLDLVGEQSSGGIGKYSKRSMKTFIPTYDFVFSSR